MPIPSPDLFPASDLWPEAPEGFDPKLFVTTGGFTKSPLNEEFRSPLGTWDHYDAYDPATRAILRKQQHIDIRDFNSADRATPLSVLDLSRFEINDLNGAEVDDFDDPLHILVPGEHWSIGTNVILTTHNNWRVLQIPLTAGTFTTVSLTNPIDIGTDFANDDFISLSLPSFPLASVTTSTSTLDFTSNPDGNFTTGPTVSVPFDATINPLVAGNSELRFLRSMLDVNALNLTAITGVRIKIVATGSATINFAALRILSKNWKFGSVDLNTRRGILQRTVAPNANPLLTPEFVQPIVWRSAEVPGEEDPKPIDFNIAVGFNTGSQTGSNSINIYGRELTEDYMQQIDLNGLDMAQMNFHEQPDVGRAMYNTRLQADLEAFKQDQLEGLLQQDLERTADYLSASWLQFVVQWTSTNTQVSVSNNEGAGYNFNLDTPLSPNTDYVLVFEVKDTAARAAIFPLGPRGQIIFDSPAFDSTRIDDDFVYKRRKGRFGWFANLNDGDAYIESIRFRSASYAEYRSLPYESITPVVGAELYTEASPIIELFTAFEGTHPDIVVDRDRERAVTDESYRITDYGKYTYQGVMSNQFDITDFEQTEIALDVFYPFTTDLEATLEFFLQNEADYLIALPRPKIFQDQWQTVRLKVPSAHLAQTGLYRLIVVQNKPVNLNWWIDNVHIFERTISWYGRAFVDDPWAATEDDWTPFRNSTNQDFGGILFQDRGLKLQVKAVGHKQEATIAKVQFKPRYADLGRFVWPEDELQGLQPPVAAYTVSNSGRLYTFNGSISSDPDGRVINWYWTVSDGSVHVGPVIQHQFETSGTYTVTLTVMDANGLINSTSGIHSVA